MNISVNGPKILFSIYDIHITETIVNGWIVIILITLTSIYLTHNLSIKNPSKRQIVAEKLYTMVYTLVNDVMGKQHTNYVPYIGTLFAFSIIGSLIGLTGLRPVTADLGTTLGWSIITFALVQLTNIRYHGTRGWLKSFTEPVSVITPLNIISEIANPISMAFRHFGNIASGVVITSLIYAALAALSDKIVDFIPILQIGLPAVLSIYFDLFTSFLQAYIISMLTMVFISTAAK